MRAVIVALLVLLWAAATFGISFGVSEWRDENGAKLQIETLRQDLADVGDQVSGLEETARDVGTLKADVSRLESRAGETSTDAASLQNFATCADAALVENVVLKTIVAFADIQQGGRAPTESEIRDWQRLYELDVEECR